jgi:hypothetical protein
MHSVIAGIVPKTYTFLRLISLIVKILELKSSGQHLGFKFSVTVQ